MKLLFVNKTVYIVCAVAIIGIILTLLYRVNTTETATVVTTIAEIGTVRETVSASGIVEAKQTAELAFPVVGTVRTVEVERGRSVKTGDVLVTLDTRSLAADKQEAMAALQKVLADREELLAGPTASSQSVTTETLASQKAALATTRENEAQKIKNAYRTLLSSDLQAYAIDSTTQAKAPTITGTYNCDTDGTYRIVVYASAAQSGYSFTLSGLETGTYTAYTDQAGPLGTCGLTALFDSESRYSNTEWIIEIPNARSATYIIHRNAYNLAVTQSESAIALAEQAVALAQATALNQNAPARAEVIARADAAITQAQARLNRIEVAIAERTLTAPFDGIITNLSILPGETVTTAPIVTLLAENAFELVARIPEIDIGKLYRGQKVEMKFDTKPSDIQQGVISFVSPRSTQIDGVAYFEAVIQLTELPDWIRSGLHADIDIITQEVSDTTRIPKRFLTETEGDFRVYVYTPEDGYTTSTPVEVVLVGNDGFVAITGIHKGDTLVAPQ